MALIWPDCGTSLVPTLGIPYGVRLGVAAKRVGAKTAKTKEKLYPETEAFRMIIYHYYCCRADVTCDGIMGFGKLILRQLGTLYYNNNNAHVGRQPWSILPR